MAKEVQFLYKYFEHPRVKKDLAKMEIPLSIRQNLNPNFAIRPYQSDAFKYFLSYMDEEEHELRQTTNHLLFQMATGSGKTMMMAGIILYLYEQGYRNFLFFVSGRTIIDKTRDNFLNENSDKYLFAQTIKFGSKTIKIQEASNFASENADDITIVFKTVQKLHSELTKTTENNISLAEFEDKEVVLLADEAHHLSASTKKGVQLTMEEIAELSDKEAEIKNWEGGVMAILKANKKNLLLEFTATAELKNEDIAKKYENKLIFDYSLKQFREDKFSKEVMLYKSDTDMIDRMLQAVIMSQYRKILFSKHIPTETAVKPVVLFKSKNIDPSKEALTIFVDKIQNLKVSDLERLKTANTEGVLYKAFNFFESENLSLYDLIEQLKNDFSEERCISVNKDDEKDKLQIILNTLEKESNEYRAIFAVNKLNEGWDVLNLFDIVRISDEAGNKKDKPSTETQQEAQLVGRGARYFPFKWKNEDKYKRKFDEDLDNELRICETLYYHTINERNYISEIRKALIDVGIYEDETKEIKLYLKPEFKEKEFYKTGIMFVNERQEKSKTEAEQSAEIFEKEERITLQSGKGQSVKVFKDANDAEETTQDYLTTKTFGLHEFGKSVIYKAMRQTKHYEFNNLKSKLKSLEFEGIQTFIDKYLSKVKIVVEGESLRLNNLTQEDKLFIVRNVLRKLPIGDNKIIVSYLGSSTFKAVMVKHIFPNEIKTIRRKIGSEESKGMGELTEDGLRVSAIHERRIVKESWYSFNDCFGTSEEKYLVNKIKEKFDDVKDDYEEFYLVRNEKHFGIYDFEEGRRFEPDFVLFLKKKNEEAIKHYQIFIEPKGEHLMKEDKWKENFLIRLNNEASIEKTAFNGSKEVNNLIETFWKDDDFTVWGLPFYNEKDTKKMEFNNALSLVL